MSLRIIFMGTPEFSVPTLRLLVDAGHGIVAVYTQPPRPGGRRGLDLQKSPVHQAAELLGLPAAGVSYNADPWDGYTADRRRLLDAIRPAGVDNTVFITGDIHSSWACDIPVDAAAYPAAGTVATELVVTSVTSANIDDFLQVPEHTVGRVAEEAFKTFNHHVKYVDLDTHGFGVFEVTPSGAQMDHWYVTAKEDPASTVYFGAGFRVASGTQSVAPAPGLG
jgi:alkaline phosphatase D